MKKIYFATKEENNRRREEAFLALSGAERVAAFFRLMKDMRIFPGRPMGEEKGNFIVKKKGCGF